MEFLTQNGNVNVEITAAPTKSAIRLKKEVMRHLKNKGIFDGFNDGTIMDLKLDKIVDLLVDIENSDEFEKAVFECLKVCVYDKGGKNIRITEQLFDDIPSIREDYYEIISKCCEENLRPFFKSLVSEFKARLNAIPENQEQVLQQTNNI